MYKYLVVSVSKRTGDEWTELETNDLQEAIKEARHARNIEHDKNFLTELRQVETVDADGINYNYSLIDF